LSERDRGTPGPNCNRCGLGAAQELQRTARINANLQCFLTASRWQLRGATMVRLKPRQRVALGETLRALANLAATAFVFTQFVTQTSPSLKLVAVGGFLWVAFVAVALLLIGED